MKPATALVLSLAATGAVAYFVGETGPGGTLFSVFDPSQAQGEPPVPLFTYAETPTGRALLAQNPDAPPEHLRVGLQDFGLSNA